MQTIDVTEQTKLDFYNCFRLLDTLIRHKILRKDSTDPVQLRILVYRESSVDCPEGWYSENVYEIAKELAEDASGQKFLLGELQKRGIQFQEGKAVEADSYQ